MPILLADKPARRGFLLALAAVAVSPLAVRASTKATLKGKLFASAEDAGNGSFFIDPEGDSESITLATNGGGYLTDYLAGCVGRSVTITIEPESR